MADLFCDLCFDYSHIGGWTKVNSLFSKQFTEWLPHSWYAFVLMLGYIQFWIIFKIKTNTAIKIFIYGIVTLIYYLISDKTGQPYYLYTSFPGVFFGMVWKTCEDKLLSYANRRNLIISLIIGGIILFSICVYPRIEFYGRGIIKSFTFLSCIVCLLYLIRIPQTHKIISFFSKISYEMYLIQSVPIFILISWLGLKPIWLTIILVIIFDVVLAYIVSHISQKFKKYLSHRANNRKP